MSEPMFPSAEADAAAPVAVADEPSGSSRKSLLILGGVLGAVVIGGGAYLLLSSGSDAGAPAASAPTAPAAGAPAPVASPSASAAPKPVVRPASASVTTRDPFKPLFVAAVATSSGSGSGSGGTSGTPAATPAATAAPTPAAPTATVTITVAKIDIKNETATVSIDGTAYAATVGKVFAKNYMVYSVFNAKCVGVLYGDQSIPVCTTAPATITP